MLKCAKNHQNWFRHFEDISRCEPSNVVAYFFGRPCSLYNIFCTYHGRMDGLLQHATVAACFQLVSDVILFMQMF